MGNQNSLVSSEIVVDPHHNTRNSIHSGKNVKDSVVAPTGNRETVLMKNPGKDLGIDFGHNAAYKTEPNLHISELSMEHSNARGNKDSGYAMENYMSQNEAERVFGQDMGYYQNMQQAYNNNFTQNLYDGEGVQLGRDTF